MSGATTLARSILFAEPAPGVWLFSCALDDDIDQPLAAADDILSGAEQARAARFHFARDRARFARGRAFLRCVLGQHTGRLPQTLELTTGPNGKPTLLGYPWFNLSHSAGLAVLAISDNGPVGIDVELIDRRVDALALGQTCLLPAEIAALSALSGSELQERFLAFWTAKEARMKLTGEGMSLAPQAIELDLSAGWPTGYLCPITPQARLIRPIAPMPGAVCHLALLNDPGAET